MISSTKCHGYTARCLLLFLKHGSFSFTPNHNCVPSSCLADRLVLLCFVQCPTSKMPLHENMRNLAQKWHLRIEPMYTCIMSASSISCRKSPMVRGCPSTSEDIRTSLLQSTYTMAQTMVVVHRCTPSSNLPQHAPLACSTWRMSVCHGCTSYVLLAARGQL